MKRVYLIGAGMGTADSLTQQALSALRDAELVLGAERLLRGCVSPERPQRALVLGAALAEEIHSSSAQTIAVLLSGDPGFYSGASGLYERLADCEVITLPGISSVNYFCAKLKKSWQELALFSAHGRDCDVVGEVQTHKSCLFLTGGRERAEALCRRLCAAGYGALRCYVGEWLSYPEERLVCGTAAELAEQCFADLSVLLVENPAPVPAVRRVAALADGDFARGKVPMTKETVRLAALSALRLREDSIVWDVGAGTGSVSVGCALSAPRGRVFAIEKKAEALQLLQENRRRFSATNLFVVEGTAPEVCESLPTPDCVFIGGTEGRMREIFALILQKNPAARIVLTAISLESLCEALDCMRDFALREPELSQLTHAHSRALGRYHMMTGENPIWLLSCGGSAAE